MEKEREMSIQAGAAGFWPKSANKAMQRGDFGILRLKRVNISTSIVSGAAWRRHLAAIGPLPPLPPIHPKGIDQRAGGCGTRLAPDAEEPMKGRQMRG